MKFTEMDVEVSMNIAVLIVACLIVIAVLLVVIVYFFLKQKYAQQEHQFKVEVEERLKLTQAKNEASQLNQNLINENTVLKQSLSVAETEKTAYKNQLLDVQNKYQIIDSNLAEVSNNYANTKGILETLNENKKSIEKELDYLKESEQELKTENIQLREINRSMQERLNQNAIDLQNLNQQFKKEFENLANKIFEEKSSKFTDQNKSNLNTILHPFKDQIESFRKKIEDNYGKESNERTSLRTELEMLRKMNNQISEDAQNLTKALKGDKKTQGDWGEMILDSVLSKSGLREGSEYYIQPTYSTDEGEKQRPDVVVNYPGEKQVIIDSKVSLNAYERFVNAEQDNQQEKEIALHIRALKAHVEELAKRDYQKLEGIRCLDYVIMFVPVEPAFLVALQYDDSLWDYAYKRKVVLVGPTTLMATLKVIEELWRNEHQQKNIEDLVNHATKIYDKARGFVDTMLVLQKKVGDSKTEVDKAIGKLTEGKGNLISLVHQMNEKGNLSPKKKIAPSLIEDAIRENNNID
ncbi:DNA recombination protein RmuC [Flammeovirga kamogawensis]|uniref:DNA recombination protein RmuC n=2 Tax=Flammeovirga kamogawensis TaxID=373891 RepID=A0ABX8GWM2_9BACT|nr:DNA recombination protein RmuC [Flammeovirga kamogawensis]MBB6459596.1 DNA recombination protein RmuC [Flammeovirga kamogawensis]QWG07340.1 DNA recombination protein RmuC [Flammeovirga kamogawensis]TRX69157.1 DNA recombination protein RmuC [Flammeovirga kamogawensis]